MKKNIHALYVAKAWMKKSHIAVMNVAHQCAIAVVCSVVGVKNVTAKTVQDTDVGGVKNLCVADATIVNAKAVVCICVNLAHVDVVKVIAKTVSPHANLVVVASVQIVGAQNARYVIISIVKTAHCRVKNAVVKCAVIVVMNVQNVTMIYVPNVLDIVIIVIRIIVKTASTKKNAACSRRKYNGRVSQCKAM